MQLAAERRLFDCLQSILIFLSRILPFKFIIIVIQLMFLGINMFLALLKQMSLSRAKNIFMPANINSIVILEDRENGLCVKERFEYQRTDSQITKFK